MKSYTKWSDLRKTVADRVGNEALDQGKRRIYAQIRIHRLVERREDLGLSQADVAQAMGVTDGVVDSIESGELTDGSDIAAYVWALGGTPRFIADFGDQLFTVPTNETIPDAEHGPCAA